jgi:mannitol/fructose-specific phosphotransferase system IIA component (Ntr-type)
VREGVLQKKLSHEISSLVHDLSIGFLAPIFFVTSGFSVSLSVFQTDLGFLVAVVLVATVTKVVGATLFYLPTGRNWREGFVAGLAMNGRGAVEIILAQLGLELGLISQRTFSVLVFMAFFTTATVPVFLKWGVAWLKRRGELELEQVGVRRTVIFGAGPIGMAFARLLSPHEEVVFIDRNREHCLAAEREGNRVVEGDALRYETLEEAGAGEAQRLIAVSSNSDINSLVAGYARENFRIPEVYALIPSLTEGGMHALLEELGVMPLTAGNIPIEEWERWIALGNTENDELQVLDSMSAREAADTWFEGQHRLPLTVFKGDGHPRPFRMDQPLEPGDRVAFVRYLPTSKPGEAGDKFDELIARAHIFDLEGDTDRHQLFERLSHVFSERLGFEPAMISAGLHARESQGGTVLAPGIAVPHVELEEPGRLELIVVRAKEGVRFEEHAPAVKAIFAVATSRDERTAYLRVLSAIAQILRSPTFAQRWLELDGPEGIREFLRTAKRLRF